MVINFPDAPTNDQYFAVGKDGFQWKAALGVWVPLSVPRLNVDETSRTTWLGSNFAVGTTPTQVMTSPALGEAGVPSKWKVSAYVEGYANGAAVWFWAGLYRGLFASSNIFAMTEVLIGAAQWTSPLRMEGIYEHDGVIAPQAFILCAAATSASLALGGPGFNWPISWRSNRTTSLTTTRIG